MANEKKQYWAASDGSIVLFDYNDENDDLEDYIIENWGDCEYGEFSSFTDLRNEEEEEWFNQQAFKGTSWNYVLDEAEKHFKCSLNSEMNNKERIIHDCLYKLWIKLKEEEEEEEEEERYCDNDDCPYGGFCCFEVLEEHKGKPYICEGCSTGIGLQEQETNPFNNDTLWKEHGKADLPYWNRLLDEAEDKVRLLKYMKP